MGTVQLRLNRAMRLIAVLVLLVCALALRPPTALADAPDTRGPHPSRRGSTSTAHGSAAISGMADWQQVRELPPPGNAMRSPATLSGAPMRQSGGENGPIAWLGRSLNPGNWILDAGMGIFAGIVKTFSGLLQKVHMGIVGDASVIPIGCDSAATNFVFCTPGSLTYDHPGVQAIWSVLRSIAASIVTILFVVRIGRMIVEGPRTLATEGKGLLLTFLFALVFIQATYPVCKLLVDFFNGISGLLLSRAALAFPSVEANDLNVGSNLMFLFFWIVILLLTIKCFFRLIRIIVLLSIAPLAGAMLMDRSTSGRFKSWLDKLIELFFEQINLVIVFVVAAAIVKPFQDRSLGDSVMMSALSIITLLMALMGPSMIGLASGAGSIGYLQSMMTVGALRRAGRVLGGGGRPGASSRTANRSDDGGSASAHVTQPTPAVARSAMRFPGDPTQSAAAQRQNSRQFGLGDTGERLASTRAASRYKLAAQAPRDDAGRMPLDARREQALMRAALMRQRAGELRAQGDRAAADTLKRKAQVQDRFGRGGQVARPAPFTPEQRSTRRQVHQQALAEVGGMHALERDALAQRIRADEQRLPILERDLAMTGATGGDTAALHGEHTELTGRLATNRARLTALTPHQGEQTPRATRAAATALANERLPLELRSRPYATRHGAAMDSAFVQRIAEAGTQPARDELARARATGARMAATPANQRPPIARLKHGSTERLKGAERSGSEQPAARQNARPSRAPSSTIAKVRQRQLDAARKRALSHDQQDAE